MTTQMIIVLIIMIGMIIAIMSDKFSFGAPPLVACCLLVLTGVSTIQSAFQGFTNTNVIMVAGFMTIAAALQKTRLMDYIKKIMGNLANKGGFMGYILLVIAVMIGACLMGGSTGYYVMVLTLATAIPYSSKLPNSKLVMPMGFASGRALIPINTAFYMGIASTTLDSAGVQEGLTMVRYNLMVGFMSIAYLIWAILAYKILPDYDINAGGGDKSAFTLVSDNSNAPALPVWKEFSIYAAFLISIVCMVFGDQLNLGEKTYIIPCLATAFLVLIGVFSFKEARNNLFSPLILMMASVIGVAAALSETGFTAMVGSAIAGVLGNSISPFILVFVFCLLTSACSTITGASIGSVFIFAPIAIATCQSLGLSPVACAAALTVSAWGGGFLPIDGLPAMILGMGKYKLSQFLTYSLPMYIFQMVGLTIGALIAFPM